MGLTRIDGLELDSVLKILSEIGVNLSRFAGVKHLSSWLGSCPVTKISSSKVLSAHAKCSAAWVRQSLKVATMRRLRAGGILQPAACAHGQTPRHVTTHKLARMVYFMLTRSETYVDEGQQRYEELQRQRSMAALKRRAAALDFQLDPVEAPA